MRICAGADEQVAAATPFANQGAVAASSKAEMRALCRQRSQPCTKHWGLPAGHQKIALKANLRLRLETNWPNNTGGWRSRSSFTLIRKLVPRRYHERRAARSYYVKYLRLLGCALLTGSGCQLHRDGRVGRYAWPVVDLQLRHV